MARLLNEELELAGTPDEQDELVRLLVRDCGCGCSYEDGELVNATPGCAAVRMLRDRRFVFGALFARRLRRQLEAEEWTRPPPRSQPRTK
jgi:hypothetical protein